MNDLVGTYDWTKGGSQEKYTQVIELRSDGSATYREDYEDAFETFTRSGAGKWTIDKDETVFVICESMTKDTKAKKKISPMPGYKDEIKVDYNVAVDIPVQKLKTAPASGPSAPKNRWTKRK
eukprot:TRINITY_DN4506_c0_g1_i1.p1 TRINITY_DN4506_c0_g1~~TRINITY_DN4506_c0_g1_i1.p1  ORF type:complete len:138 (-),score=38.48 TRINITY_DN4506_c0_g1_i1:60-425(-)